MKSMISSLVFIFIAFLLSLAHAAPVELSPRDVFVPPVLSPDEDSVWKIGSTQTVIWDVSHPPTQITNNKATVILVKKGRLDIDHPLATGIDVLDGQTEVVVPNVIPGNDYQILVMGDSGNTGKVFTIVE